MDFTLREKHRMLQDTGRRFVRQELLPLEFLVLQRDTQGMTGEDLLPKVFHSKELDACSDLSFNLSYRKRQLPGSFSYGQMPTRDSLGKGYENDCHCGR